MSRPLRVLIADDDDLMRAGLRAVLSSDETIEVVGEAADGREAVTLTRRLDPDLVLMDVRMPTLDGVAATREILAGATRTRARILILTTFSDDDYVLGAIAAGAAGFLLKRTRPEQLITALHTVAAGDALLSPAVTRTVLDRLGRQVPPARSAQRRLAVLTPRERDVFTLIGRGLSNAEIAGALVVEESTVKTHVKRIMAKLELRDRIQAVILAYESGVIRPGDPTPGDPDSGSASRNRR